MKNNQGLDLLVSDKVSQWEVGVLSKNSGRGVMALNIAIELLGGNGSLKGLEYLQSPDGEYSSIKFYSSHPKYQIKDVADSLLKLDVGVCISRSKVEESSVYSND